MKENSLLLQKCGGLNRFAESAGGGRPARLIIGLPGANRFPTSITAIVEVSHQAL